MIDDPKCTFCKIETETLIHLFCECQCIQSLWAEVSDKMEKSIFEYQMPLTNQIKIFGFYKHLSNPDYLVWSHISILLKYYIHMSRLDKKVPYIGVFKKRIKYVENLEYRIAKKNGKLIKHFRKWEPYLI